MNYPNAIKLYEKAISGSIIYPEHNIAYLNECIDNLKNKGIELKEGFKWF